MKPAAASRIFDALERGLVHLALRRAESAFAAAVAVGRLRNRLSRRWPSPEQVQRLFSGLDRHESARVAWSIGGVEACGRLVAACIQRAGLEPVRPLVRISRETLAALRPPVILGTFHAGILNALPPALERLPAPVLALRHTLRYAPRPPLEVMTLEADVQLRAAFFRRALEHLSCGGIVVLALDVVPGPAFAVPCLGRELAFARGPFALARLAGVPLAPILARWRHGGVEVVLGGALTPDAQVDSAAAPEAWESALAVAAARWLEDHLLASPVDTGIGLIRNLLGCDLSLPNDRN